MIRIWSTSLGSPIKTLWGYTADVLVIDQLSNGNLISGSSDGSSVITDLSTGNSVNTMVPISTNDAVNCLKELPDGKIAFAGGSSQKIHTWKISGPYNQLQVATSDDFISATPCKDMIIYNSSILAVSSNSNLTYLVDITSSINLQKIKTLTLTTTIANCLETNCKFF